MPNEEQVQMFNALGDATRFAVVEHLSRGPAAVSELAAPFDMALPSFTQHMGVLERSGLVRSEKKGRVRTYFLVPKKLKKAESWLNERRTFWKKRLDQLDTYLLEMKENSK